MGIKTKKRDASEFEKLIGGKIIKLVYTHKENEIEKYLEKVIEKVEDFTEYPDWIQGNCKRKAWFKGLLCNNREWKKTSFSI